MAFYREQVLPRLVELTCGGTQMAGWRAQAADGLAGTIVEIGFGSGLNVPVYPPEVTEVLAVEPALVARERAADRIAASHARVRHIGLDGQRLPLDDDSCDGALSTFTLCTIPDVEAALRELARVLKPGAPLHVLEHGLAPDEGVVRWQQRLEPIQRRVADGCHLTRDPIALLEGAGFTVVEHRSGYAKGPKPYTYITTAKAIAPT
jgi:ubiquinone/menaquinone biosynthesis C-methylase UbiE